MLNHARIASITKRATLVVALVVALSLPLGYWVIMFRDLSANLQFKAKVKATAFSSLIAGNPELWIYAENQMQGRLTREPVPLDTELIEVYDAEGVRVTQAGQTPAPPRLSKSYPLYDATRVVGRIEVSHSLRELMYGAAVAAAFGLLLGAAVFALMRSWLGTLRQALQALVNSESRFRTLVDLLPYGVQENDLTGRVTFANPALERLHGQPEERIVGRFVWDFLADDAKRELLRDCLQVLIREQPPPKPYFAKERRADDRLIDVQVDWAYRRNAHGQVQGFISIITDITTRKQMEEALREQATHDPLTGLLNRRYLNEALPRELHRCQRSGEPLTVAMLDLDYFKHFNDLYGHEAGDIVLRSIGDLLGRSVRAGDIACRYGGEELTIVMPGSAVENARPRLDSLRQAIMRLNLHYRESELPAITVSIGVAEAGPEETDADTLLARADAALYQAKAQGRNRVIVVAN